MELNKFDDLMNLGQIKRKIKLGSHEVSLHTLGSLEYSKVLDRVGPGAIVDGKKLELLQRSILVQALDTVDGERVTEKEKEHILGGGQLGLSNLLYSEYLSMVDEQNKVLEDAKKNSSQPEETLAESLKA